MSKFIKVAKISDLNSGEKMRVWYENEEVGLINLDGKYYAISDICTHDSGPLMDGELEGECIICPRHGAKFNVITGEETMPAYEPVPLYDVRIEGEDILIAPKEE